MFSQIFPARPEIRAPWRVETPRDMNPQTPDQLLSLEKAARRLDISPRSLYRVIARGELPCPVKIGRSSKLCQSDLDAYLQALKAIRP